MGKNRLAVYIKKNHHYFKLKLKYKDLDIYLLHDVAGFLNIAIWMHNIYHLKTQKIAERIKCCGMEDWTVVANDCRKTKA